MGPAVAMSAADAAFDTWLRMDLHTRYGAVAATPVPCDLIRLVQGYQSMAWPVPAMPSGAWGAEDIAPARGLAVAVLASGLFWAVLAGAAQTLWG